MSYTPSQPLRAFFLKTGWPADTRALDRTLAWLDTHGMSVVLDMVDLSDVDTLPGASSLEPVILQFLHKCIEARVV